MVLWNIKSLVLNRLTFTMRCSLAILFLGSSSSFSESPSASIAGSGSADTSEATAPGGPAEDDAARPNDFSSSWMKLVHELQSVGYDDLPFIAVTWIE